MVGLGFNPSNMVEVDATKKCYADLIDTLHNMKVPESDNVSANQRNAFIDIAIKEAVTAQMWAVKAITFK